MKTSQSKGSKFLILAVSIFMLSCTHSNGDINESKGYQFSDNIALGDKFKSNLNNLFNSLSSNVAPNGFYKSTFGKNSDKVYGLAQCRADISPANCTNCINESINVALQNISNSNSVEVWFTWCFLRYSNKSFFGVWEKGSMGVTTDMGFDDAAVVPKGVAFMSGIASMAPNKPRMVEMSVLDVGQSGKRYGMAQCRRDLSRSDCGKCLDDQLMSFTYSVEDKRGWEIYGMSCNRWYHDFQFYSNISITASAGVKYLINSTH
ncbi:cysteine-rich repeat secretory protein 38-like [Camellia sinensis]|uniref:cysteine-rich repeat secretory protein 38-like n=1 Tax=Camellia sinensis TaxID=4442 RepID=UPI001035EA35|nr:cysteine-rich repeat secretory protein 38-like [Camellia sinensis]